MTYIALGLIAAFVGSWVAKSGEAKSAGSEYGTAEYRSGARVGTVGAAIKVLSVVLCTIGVISWLSYY